MEGDLLELYKLVCLVAASVVVFFIILFIIRDLFIDMRNQNISQISQKREKAKEMRNNESTKKRKFSVYKGSNKKKANSYRDKPKLVKVK